MKGKQRRFTLPRSLTRVRNREKIRSSPEEKDLSDGEDKEELDFEFYVPELHGPLTVELLKRITQQPGYQREGFTALMVASYVGDVAMVKHLLGIQTTLVGAEDRVGRTARDWAELALKEDYWEQERLHEVIVMLVR